MQNTQVKHGMSRIKAFTLIESLVTLAITSFLILSFSDSITQTFAKVEEHLFFLSFEHLYRDTQKLSVYQRQDMTLILKSEYISNGVEVLKIPKDVKLERNKTLHFDQAGGNSSLEKLVFQASDEKRVTYQLYIGSGQYKKTES